MCERRRAGTNSCPSSARGEGSGGVESALDGSNPLVAALLSAVFPGLGHVYARDVVTDAFFSVSFLLAVFSLLFAVGFVLVPLVWLYAIYDAARDAQRREEERSPARRGV